MRRLPVSRTCFRLLLFRWLSFFFCFERKKCRPKKTQKGTTEGLKKGGLNKSPANSATPTETQRTIRIKENKKYIYIPFFFSTSVLDAAVSASEKEKGSAAKERGKEGKKERERARQQIHDGQRTARAKRPQRAPAVARWWSPTEMPMREANASMRAASPGSGREVGSTA